MTTLAPPTLAPTLDRAHRVPPHGTTRGGSHSGCRTRHPVPRHTASHDQRPGTCRIPTARRQPPVSFEQRQHTSARDLPDAAQWAGRVLRAVAETACGVRPDAQASRFFDEPAWRVARAFVRQQARPRLRRVVVNDVLDGVVEVVALVDFGTRCRALALRIEGLDGRWVITTAQAV